MSGKSGLEDRLAALAAVGLAGVSGRVVRASEPKVLIRRLLAEFDTIIMPRRVVVENPAGLTAAFEIANRRIIRVGEASGHPALSDVAEQDPTAATEKVPPAFAALVSGTDTVRLRFEPMPSGFDPEHTGMAADGILQLLGLSQTPVDRDDPGEVFDTFLSRIQEDTLAWVISAEGTTEAAGDADALEALEAAMPELPEQDEGVGWTLTAFATAATAPHFTVVADLAEARLILATTSDRLGHLTDQWRATLAG